MKISLAKGLSNNQLQEIKDLEEECFRDVKCSEYRMKFDESAIPSFPNLGILLRKAEHKDYTQLQLLDALCFGLPMAETEIHNRYNMTYVAEREGEIVGKIGVLMEGNDGYIFGFGIKPDYRRQGFGRKVLSLILSKLTVPPYLLDEGKLMRHYTKQKELAEIG